MKLPIEKIAPYLPYKLQIARFDINDNYKRVDHVLNGKTIYNVLNYKNLKPILRPLADLCKEIQIDGEKFIPLKKLHQLDKINYFDDSKENYKLNFIDTVISIKHEIYSSLNSEEFILKYLVETGNMGDLVYSFTYSPNLRRFGTRNETHRKPLGNAYQLDMFNKLYEWHFDISNLIPQGLAIDINTIK